MLSRDADSCYWIGRYVERAEATARMVDVHYHAALESAHPANGEAEIATEAESDEDGDVMMRWEALLAISGNSDVFYQRYGTANEHNVMHFFVFDSEHSNSIVNVWRKARENARSIREQIASEMWESLNITYLELREWDVDRVVAGGPHEFFHLVKNASHLFQGILNRTMLMGETRDWLDTGRFLERGNQTARLLDVKYHDLLPATVRGVSEATAPLPQVDGVGGVLDMHGWIAVLKSVSAFEMYRKTYKDGIRPATVVDFLVLHPQFPASVRHCIGRVEGCLRRISGNQRDEPTTEPERLIGRLRADLTYSRPDEIIVNGLHEYLESVQNRCGAVGNAITRTYLSY